MAAIPSGSPPVADEDEDEAPADEDDEDEEDEGGGAASAANEESRLPALAEAAAADMTAKGTGKGHQKKRAREDAGLQLLSSLPNGRQPKAKCGGAQLRRQLWRHRSKAMASNGREKEKE